MNKMTLSLCMIVKNESTNLDNCLKSVCTFVDEIIIVDTGSADNTVEIAKKYTNKIYDFKWIDDFSAARNFSLDQASSDWILVLDADECLAERDIKFIKNELIYESDDAFELVKRSYANDPNIGKFQTNDNSYPEGNGWLGWQNEPNDLLFRNDARIFYEDRIHETVRKSILRSGLKIRKTEIPIHHYGRHDMTKKADHYIELVKERYKTNPNDLDNLFTLGSHLDWEGRIEEAHDVFLKCEKMDDVRAYYALGLTSMKLQKFADAKRYYLKAIEKDPLAYDIAFKDLMTVYFIEGNYNAAFDIYKQGLDINPRNIMLQYSLANIYYKMGYSYVARSELQRIVKEYPHYREASELLSQI